MTLTKCAYLLSLLSTYSHYSTNSQGVLDQEMFGWSPAHAMLIPILIFPSLSRVELGNPIFFWAWAKLSSLKAWSKIISDIAAPFEPKLSQIYTLSWAKPS